MLAYKLKIDFADNGQYLERELLFWIRNALILT